MQKLLCYATVSALSLAGSAFADAPSVAVDIPPIHSLVAKIMQGIGTPNLIIQPGASPHGYALRPSEAAALQSAEIVFWVGEELTPWLGAPIAALARNAKSVELLEVDGTTELAFREGVTFDKHNHDEGGHDEGGHDEGGHDEGGHDEGGHDEGGHDEDRDDEGDHHEDGHMQDGNPHGHHDPHAWLDPENARIWLDVIATDLARIDPDHAELYAANAIASKTELAVLINEINTDLETFRGTDFIVFHDAFQYFENRFDVGAIGAISLGDASDPSPARVAKIRDKVIEFNVTCAFTEPQFNPGLVQAVLQGTSTVTGVLDPLGSDLPIGTDLYPQLLRNLANTFSSCHK